jgi:hypothetical protein
MPAECSTCVLFEGDFISHVGRSLLLNRVLITAPLLSLPVV